MGFSQTFLQGFQVGSTKKLQQEAQLRQAERDKQQAALELEDLKIRQASAKHADQKARFESDLHPLELEKAIQEAGLVPADTPIPPDVAGGAPGGGAVAGPLPPPAALGQPPGASPSAPAGVGGDVATAPEPTPRTLSDTLNIGGQSFRRKTLKERMAEVEGVASAKAGAEAKAKAQYEFLPEDVNIPGIGVIPKGTPINATGSVISGTAGLKEGAARNATTLEAARINASNKGLKVRNVPGVGLVLDRDVENALSGGAGNGVEVGPGGIPTIAAGPPAATKARIDLGRQMLASSAHIKELLADPTVQAHLGPISGRITTLQQLAGVPDPKVQELSAALRGYTALAQGIHGFRSAEMAEHLFEQLGGNKFTPEAISAALDGLNTVAKGWDALGNEHGYKSAASTPGGNPKADALKSKYGLDY